MLFFPVALIQCNLLLVNIGSSQFSKLQSHSHSQQSICGEKKYSPYDNFPLTHTTSSPASSSSHSPVSSISSSFTCLPAMASFSQSNNHCLTNCNEQQLSHLNK